MIKVLNVTNWLQRGGVETQLLKILQWYGSSRFHMDICCSGDKTGYLAEEAREYGATVLHYSKSINLYAFSNRMAEVIANSRDYVVKHFDSNKSLPKLEEMYFDWIEEGSI